jgi:hypothetical protein
MRKSFNFSFSLNLRWILLDRQFPIHFLTGLQRHYAVLQALTLDEDDMPEINDETLPDEEGMAR